jgi:low affinity Fe/Cu permease
MNEWFSTFANQVSILTGRPIVFITATALLVLWAVFGPVTGYSEQWQLLVNTGTTILTFLMVFIIQNAQNRHATAMQIKMDEIIRAIAGARNDMIDLENLSEAQLAELQVRFTALGEKARKGDIPEIDPVDLPAVEECLEKGAASARSK